jgi:hypothetical protein
VSHHHYDSRRERDRLDAWITRDRPDDFDYGPQFGEEEDPQFTEDTREICRYFALCDHWAVGTVKNPVLGEVPVCQRCLDKMNRIGPGELEFTPYVPQ